MIVCVKCDKSIFVCFFFFLEARQLCLVRVPGVFFFFNVRCFKDILEAEEERVETGLAIEDMEATGVDT